MDRLGRRAVAIFPMTAVIVHGAQCYTRYDRFTYTVGGDPRAARISGVNANRRMMPVCQRVDRRWTYRRKLQAARPFSGKGAFGFTLMGIDAYTRMIIKGIIMVDALITGQYRHRRRCKA